MRLLKLFSEKEGKFIIPNLTGWLAVVSNKISAILISEDSQIACLCGWKSQEQSLDRDSLAVQVYRCAAREDWWDNVAALYDIYVLQ